MTTPNQKSHNTPFSFKLRSHVKNNNNFRPRRSVHRNPPNYCEDAIDGTYIINYYVCCVCTCTKCMYV